MKYSYSREWTARAREITVAIGLKHIDSARVSCIISKGSKARRAIARIHALGKAMQSGMQAEPFYTIELISEKFDRLSEEDKARTLIHELLHIPHSFGGGFRHHKLHVNSRTVEQCFNLLKEKSVCPGILQEKDNFK